MREERSCSNCSVEIIPLSTTGLDCQLSFPLKALLSPLYFLQPCSLPVRKPGGGCGCDCRCRARPEPGRVRTRRSQHRHQSPPPPATTARHSYFSGFRDTDNWNNNIALITLLGGLLASPVSSNDCSDCCWLTWHNLHSWVSLNRKSHSSEQSTDISATHEFFPMEDFEI